jgi:hypothetical protein
MFVGKPSTPRRPGASPGARAFSHAGSERQGAGVSSLAASSVASQAASAAVNALE